MNRIEREKHTIACMIRLYCLGKKHADKAPCQDCLQLLEYAHTRLDRCRFGNNKPTCVKCPVHCYGKDMRHRVQGVMRYSGPRMTLHHPVLAIRHLMDERRKMTQG